MSTIIEEVFVFMARHFSQILLAVLSVLVISTQALSAPGSVVAIADSWCPYTCYEDDPAQGFLLDLSRDLLVGTEFKLEYRVTPWERAVTEAKDGRADLLLGLAAGEAGEQFDISFFSWSSPTCGYTLNASDKKIKTLNDLHNFKSIGAAKGYYYGDNANKLFETDESIKTKIQYLGTNEPAGANLKKVAAGRVELAIEDPGVATYLLKKMKISGLKNVGCLPEVVKIHIGLSKKAPHYEALSKHFHSRIKELRKSGRLKTLARKYALDPQ